MSPSLHRSDPAAPAPIDPDQTTAVAPPDRELLTVSEELSAIFAKAFTGFAAGETGKGQRRAAARRPVFQGSRPSRGRLGLLAAGLGAGMLGLCLGALMEKTALLSRPQSSDGAALAAVALASTPLPPTPLPPTPLPPTPLPPTPLPPTPLPTTSSPPAPSPTASSLSTSSFQPPAPLAPAGSPTADASAAESAPFRASSPPPAPPPSVAAGAASRAKQSPPTAMASVSPNARLQHDPRPSHKPLRLALLAAPPLVAEAPPVRSEPAAPAATDSTPSALTSPPVAAPFRPAPGRVIARCDWRGPCGPSSAVMQADSRLRQAYSAAARAGVDPHILEAYRQNWAEMRYALGDQPPQLLNGYRQLTESLWQARRLTLSGQDLRPVYEGSDRDYGGPPE